MNSVLTRLINDRRKGAVYISQSAWDRLSPEYSTIGGSLSLYGPVGLIEIQPDASLADDATIWLDDVDGYEPITYDPSDGSAKGVRG